MCPLDRACSVTIACNVYYVVRNNYTKTAPSLETRDTRGHRTILVARTVSNCSRRACTPWSPTPPASWPGWKVTACGRRRACSRHPTPWADERRLATEEVGEPILTLSDGRCERQPRASVARRAWWGDAAATARDGTRGGRECTHCAVAGLQQRRRHGGPAAWLGRLRPTLHTDLPAWRRVEQRGPRARALTRVARPCAGCRLRRRPYLTAVDGGVHRRALARGAWQGARQLRRAGLGELTEAASTSAW